MRSNVFAGFATGATSGSGAGVAGVEDSIAAPGSGFFVHMMKNMEVKRGSAKRLTDNFRIALRLVRFFAHFNHMRSIVGIFKSLKPSSSTPRVIDTKLRR